MLIPVWGPRHSRTFLDLGLPTLLARGNLPSLADYIAETVVLTDEATRGTLQESPHFQRLVRNFSTRIVAEDSIIVGSCDQMSWRLNRAFDRLCPSSERRAFVVLLPDMIWTDGSFACLLRHIKAGYDSVLVPGVRIREEGLREIFPLRDDSLSLSPQQLVGLVRHKLHPLFANCDWQGGSSGIVSAHMWKTPAGLLLHNHHPWPVFFRVSCPAARIPWRQTLDHEFLEIACPEGRFKVVQSPSDLGFLEVSPSHYVDSEYNRSRRDIRDHAYWAGRWTSRLHQQFAQIGMRLWDEASTEEFADVRRHALATLESIHSLIPADESIACFRRYLDMDPTSPTFSGIREDDWIMSRSRFRAGPARAGDRFRIALELPAAQLPSSGQFQIGFGIEPGEHFQFTAPAGRFEAELTVSADTPAISVSLDFGHSFPHPDDPTCTVSAFGLWDQCRVVPRGEDSLFGFDR